MMKRILSLLLCLLLLASLTAGAFADSSTALQALGYQQNEDKLDLLLYARADHYFNEHNMSLRLNNTELTLERLSAFAGSQYGTTWLVLVEPTQDSGISRMNTELIDGLVTGMQSNDSIAVMDARTKEVTSFVSDAPTVKGFAKSALEGKGDVKLFDAVHAAAKLLEEDAPANTRKCLVILSTGVDKTSYYTVNSLYAELEKTALTVYTVGMTYYGSYNKTVESLNTLASATPSGLAFSYDQYPRTAGVEAARAIMDNNGRFYVLTASLAGVTEAEPAELVVSLDDVHAACNAAAITLAESEETGEIAQVEEEHIHEWNDDATCQHPRTCAVCGEEEPEGELAPHSYGEDGVCIWCGETENGILSWIRENMPIAIMAAALLLLLLVLVIVLIVRGRKKRENEDSGEVEDDNAGTKMLSKVTVKLVNRVTGEENIGDIYHATIKAGRSAELRLKSDPSISREQMEFLWQNGSLYVQDTNSSNGTYVNGKEIIGAVPLQQGDVIHVGDSDFVVTWRSKM